MPSKSKKHKKYGFTLAEMLMVCSIFAIMIAGLIVGINRAYVFMNQIKLQVMATNFAREGVEMVFNMRDSCFRRNSGNRDECLHNVSLSLGGMDHRDPLFWLEEVRQPNGDLTIIGHQVEMQDSYRHCYEDENFWSDKCELARMRSKDSLSFTGEYKYLSGTEMVTGDLASLLGNDIEFYRVGKSYKIYKKNATSTNSVCVRPSCGSDAPTEMRFCVKVFYRYNGTPHSTELCSVMTNFAK